MTMFPDIVGDTCAIQPFVPVRQIPLGENVTSRMRKFLRPRYKFNLSFSELVQADANSIDSHVLGQAAAALKFDWFFWAVFHWLWVPIGVGDGSTTIWTIPGLQTSDQQFFTGASTSVSGTISPGTGAQGEDRVTLTPAIGWGVSLWCNFSGRRRFTVRYEKNEQPLTRHVETGNYNFQTSLVQGK